MPDLLSENEDAEKVYLAVRDQYIMGGMGGPVALNQLAIYPAMEMYNVEFKADCFEKVVAVGRKVLAKQRESVK